ncbi:hypothetical protein CRM22_004293 [Opisthorchis felineus]|uniref:Uncharacterized protein n=1 Tax=Opisthorchis felineus TaxID=147828 RepID=A0A4S2M1Z6_OPIFE|nr:hypothetical protein CRM22_004293 [Opisthorchis felineus]
MAIQLHTSEELSATFVSVHTPKISHPESGKDEFSYQLPTVIKSMRMTGHLFLVGDPLGRIGRQVQKLEELIGPYGTGALNVSRRSLTICATTETFVLYRYPTKGPQGS